MIIIVDYNQYRIHTVTGSDKANLIFAIIINLKGTSPMHVDKTYCLYSFDFFFADATLILQLFE